jgi:hypothetical protein
VGVQVGLIENPPEVIPEKIIRWNPSSAKRGCLVLGYLTVSLAYWSTVRQKNTLPQPISIP